MYSIDFSEDQINTSAHNSIITGHLFFLEGLSIVLIFFLNTTFFRNFGDTLEDCREVERRDRNFCTTHPSKELFEFPRPVSGICNNLLPGKATVRAADTQVVRLVRKYC